MQQPRTIADFGLTRWQVNYHSTLQEYGLTRDLFTPLEDFDCLNPFLGQHRDWREIYLVPSPKPWGPLIFYAVEDGAIITRFACLLDPESPTGRQTEMRLHELLLDSYTAAHRNPKTLQYVGFVGMTANDNSSLAMFLEYEKQGKAFDSNSHIVMTPSSPRWEGEFVVLNPYLKSVMHLVRELARLIERDVTIRQVLMGLDVASHTYMLVELDHKEG
ncbi:hypothetical protein TruAng_000856 [Truncatella angustata]|nr:hypothetical protein TruAng_000856 [Truncatella angustata]